MYLVTVTRSDISDRYEVNKIICDKDSNLNIAFYSDNISSKITENKDEYSLIVTPDLDNNHSPHYLNINYNMRTRTIEVNNTFLSGFPVYYHINPDGELFISDYISLLKIGGVNLIENTELLPEFFTYGRVYPPNSLFKNIYQLKVGCKLILGISNDKVEIKDQVDYKINIDKRNMSENEAIEAVFNSISDSIKFLKDRENELGILLSGGKDSTILYKMSECLDFNIKTTYSSGYAWEEPNYEKEYSLSAAEEFGVNHEYYEVNEHDYIPALVKTINTGELPLPHMQSVLIYLLSSEYLPPDKKIVFNGSSGEKFGDSGNRYKAYNYQKTLNFKVLQTLEKRFNPLYKKIENYTVFYPKITASVSSPKHKVWAPRGDLDWVINYFKTSPQEIVSRPSNLVEDYENYPIVDIIQIRGIYGGDDTNTLWGKLGNKNNRIFYCPYSHQSCLSLGLQIPFNIALKEPRFIFNRLAKRLEIPDHIYNREKRGFNPITNVPKCFFEPLLDIVSSEFPRSEIEKMKDFSWNDTRFWALWYMINYSIWKQIWIKNKSTSEILEQIQT